MVSENIGSPDSSLAVRSSGNQRQNFQLHSLLQFLFPERCAVCERKLLQGAESLRLPLCLDCCPWTEGREFLPPGCPHCDSPSLSPQLSCDLCRMSPLPIEEIHSVFYYRGKAAEVIKAFKYRGRWRLGQTLILMASTQMARRGLLESLKQVDCIVPIPTSRRAFQRRGFHHTALLASLLSKEWGIPWERNALLSISPPVPQASLEDWRERQENIQDVFSARSGRIREKRVLLLDDVLTTGATLCEAGQTLLRAGAREVKALSICRASWYHRYRREAVMSAYQEHVE